MYADESVRPSVVGWVGAGLVVVALFVVVVSVVAAAEGGGFAEAG
jgi:hypothetical protein